MEKKLRILVAPLDWGLGHASRCVPLIQELIQQGIEPVLGGTKESLFLMKSAFPELESLALPPYRVRYSSGASQLPVIGQQIPRLMGVIKEEHRLLEKAIDELMLDAVISDNRYGLYTKKIPTVFLCHQLSLPLPSHLQFLSKAIDSLHYRFIRRFDMCWIPDFCGENNLAGKLSQQELEMDQRYVGPLSQFQREDLALGKMFSDLPPNSPDVLVVLSGPEPQRSLLESKIIEQAKSMAQTFWIVQGKAGNITYSTEANCEIISFLDRQRLLWAFSQTKAIISRSGYSSLMDYETLGLRNLLLIPTPGQTEQEHLAERWAEQGRAIVQKQADLHLRKGLLEITSLNHAEPRKRSSPDQAALLIRKTVADLKRRIIEKQRSF